MPFAQRKWMCLQNGFETGTSVKWMFGAAGVAGVGEPGDRDRVRTSTGTALPPPGATIAFAMKEAIASRVTVCCGQYVVGPQPRVTFRAAR